MLKRSARELPVHSKRAHVVRGYLGYVFNSYAIECILSFWIGDVEAVTRPRQP